MPPAPPLQRQQLPAWNFAEALADAVADHQVTIVSGHTGCGKSTQVPQFLLDDPRMGPTSTIVVTQPRRISAISLAERYAAAHWSPAASVAPLVVSPSAARLLV